MLWIIQLLESFCKTFFDRIINRVNEYVVFAISIIIILITETDKLQCIYEKKKALNEQ